MRVLVVEDTAAMRKALQRGLVGAGHAVDVAADGAEGLELARAHPWDVIVLDLMLPVLSGESVLGTLRREGHTTPVLALTAKDAVKDRVAVLDLGADDYLVKPFAFDELLARLRALVRRQDQVGQARLVVEDLVVDTAARRVERAGTPVPLSAREYALLEYLARRQGQVVTRGEIVQHVYDFAAEPGSNVVDVYIGYLRRKLDDGAARKLLHTRRGLGYCLGAP